MVDQNRRLAYRWFEEVWNRHNESAIDELFLPQGKCYGFPNPESAISPDEFKSVFHTFHNAFSDIHVTLDDILTQADTVAVRFTCSMVHTGDAMGFPPTGKTVVVGGASFMECFDGKLLNGYNFLDLTKTLTELREASAQPVGAST
jgi:predicted ester cyclase